MPQNREVNRTVHLVQSNGLKTVEEARRAALASCERARRPCEVIMENDRWLAPAL